jgi:hypothetical protein
LVLQVFGLGFRTGNALTPPYEKAGPENPLSTIAKEADQGNDGIDLTSNYALVGNSRTFLCNQGVSMALLSRDTLVHWAASAIMTGALSLAPSTNARSQEDGVSQNEIVIGAIGALTGPLSFIGTPGRDGMTLGFNEINSQEGICGRKLRLQFEHASTPA